MVKNRKVNPSSAHNEFKFFRLSVFFLVVKNTPGMAKVLDSNPEGPVFCLFHECSCFKKIVGLLFVCLFYRIS